MKLETLNLINKTAVHYKDVIQKLSTYIQLSNFDNVDQISHKSIMYSGCM